ncbi:MAG: adenylosuccinate lyase [SAR202 cluster bacterium]|nr:adenylosuccinate lyase [Chloroflexota bacterium]MDP7613664.1 adenylosuccinate lyase [Dehalococcoidia bacterium]MQG46919.1 adenylosuccinate lyase [SAR202 cluster bacterium]
MIDRYTRPAMRKIWSDEQTFELWLRIEIAACEAWAKEGVISSEEMASIRQAKFNKEAYDKWFDTTKHDVISFIRAISEDLGKEKRWIHYGLTSSDIKDTALSIQLKDSCLLLLDGLNTLALSLKKRAIEFKYLPSIGRSHGVHAEPMSFGLKFALWFSEINRQITRLELVKNHISVGMLSGPVGTFSSVPPTIENTVCEELGLKPALISNQIIQRDRHASYVQCLALIAATMEKISTEIRTLQRTEIREIEEPFGQDGYVSKGSSSMPHKRNPELSERICGISRLLRGYVITALDNVALWNERDISHSSSERVILPESSLYLDYIIDLLNGIISKMTVNEQNIHKNLNLTQGLIFSPRVMLKLVESGMDREMAYDIVQKHSKNAWENEKKLKDLVLSDKNVISMNINPKELDELFDYEFFLRYVDKIFNRANIV